MRWFGWSPAPAADVERTGLTKADVDKAYERGRKDERARRKSHPFISAMVVVVALVGAGTIFLAAREGSFAGGGAVVDHRLQSATGDASQQAAMAMNSAGRTIQDKSASSDSSSR